MPRKEGPALQPDAAAGLTRRALCGMGAAAAALAAWPSLLSASPRTNRVLRLGLIGCDSDGISLAADALKADPRIELVAFADELGPRAHRALAIFTHRLRKGGAHPRVRVEPDHLFIGEDAALSLCALPDVDAVLLAGVVSRRPRHLAAAVAAGKHAYLLPPGASDFAGCRSLVDSAALAAQRGLSLGSGLHWGLDPHHLDNITRVRNGEIGAVHTAEAFWRRGSWRRYHPGSDRETNWYFNESLSGGFLLTDVISHIDLMSWFLGRHPVSATGTTARNGNNPGNLASHYALRYDYPEDVTFSLEASLEPGAPIQHRGRLLGHAGVLDLHASRTQPRVNREAPVARFLAALRTRDQSEGARTGFDALVTSTRTAILGRQAAQRGERLHWESFV